MKQLLDAFVTVITSPYLWYFILFVGLLLVLNVWGFFTAVKRIIWDCLIDHTPEGKGKVTIINVARFSMIIVAIEKLTIGSPTITITPELKFIPNPEDNWEIMALIFAFIGGTQWIFNKYQGSSKEKLVE